MLDSRELTGTAERIRLNRRDWWTLACLGIVTAITLHRVLSAEFLSYDDPFYVTNNTLVQSGFNVTSLVRAWTTFECANWHPGTWLSLMLDYQIFGLRAWGFHLTNLLLHICNTLLLFTLLRRLKLNWGPSLFVAAVFAVHPLHVESVAWVTERKDVLANIFGLLSLLAYVEANRTGCWRDRVLSCFWYFCSLTAKPMLVTLPCLLLLLDYWPLRRHVHLANRDNSENAGIAIPGAGWDSRRFRTLVAEKWPFWLLAAGSSIITMFAQQGGGAVATLRRFSLSERFINICIAYCSYLQKSFWPTRLAVYYPYALNRWSVAGATIGIAFLGVVTVLAWRLRRQRPEILLGWLWFLGTLVPMIGLVQVGTQAMADRYMYFPLTGLAWAVTGLALHYWPAGRFARLSQVLVSGGLIFALCVLTYWQTGVWQNNILLSQHALRVTPANYIAHEMHARALRVAGLTDHAIAEYRQAIAINPEYFSARNDLGLLLLQQNDLEGAAEQFRLALETVPQHSRLRWNLARTLARQHHFQAADEQFRLAEQAAPHNDALLLDHARILQAACLFPQAIAHYERAVQAAPHSIVNRLELAVALSKAPAGHGQDLARAAQMLQQLCQQTDAPRAWIALAETYVAAGNRSSAETAWKRAIERATALKRPDLADLARQSSKRPPPR